MRKIDKEKLLEWLKSEFYLAKGKKESAKDIHTRTLHQGEMNAFQYLKYAIDTGDFKEDTDHADRGN